MSTADRLATFGQTIFTEMTALALKHGAINLGQGFPDWAGAEFVKKAAVESMASGDHDQYPPSAGVPALRQAIADRYAPLLGRELNPAEEISVTTGCTEALAASFLGLVNPGEEVVVIEPFYDAYPACVALAGAIPRFVRLRPPQFSFDLEELRGAFNSKTRALILNTPHNPSGRIFNRDELSAIADLCKEFDVMVISDEVYEEMTFGESHTRIATLPGMWERTLTVSSLGKSFSLTGWKLGWAIGPAPLTSGLRAAHQFLTFTTPTPVQHGAIAAMKAPTSFFNEMRDGYKVKRDLMSAGLKRLDFEVYVPEGTYFMMAGFGELGFTDDRQFARHLVEKVGVAAIPTSVFYGDQEGGTSMVRFAFCKDEATLNRALECLASLR